MSHFKLFSVSNNLIQVMPKFPDEMEVKVSKATKVKIRIRELFEITTIHGIPYIIISREIFIKLLWLICLTGSAAFCTYFIIKSITNFLSYDVVTMINTFYELKSQFPTISFCSTLSSFEKFPVFKCQFNSDDCLGDFEKFEEINYGNCYRFNSGINLSMSSFPILYSKVAGNKYGLKMDLNVSQLVNKYNYNELAVYIHNYTEKPVNIMHRGYRLLSGSINYFQIDKVVDEKLNEPYNQCYKDWNEFKSNRTLIDFLNSKNNSYSLVECIRLCRNLKNYDESGCNCVRYNDYENTLYCSNNTNSTIKQCYHDFTREFQKRDVFEICSNYCPIECDTTSYVVQTFTEYLPVFGNVSEGQDFSAFKTYEKVQRDYISIRVYFQELKYTRIKQQPKTETFDLVSNVGGTLGLFLGVSFLSFIEIIACMIETIFILIKN